MAKLLQALNGLLALPLLALIYLYRWILSPALHALFGPMAGCRFEPSCSMYALTCYKTMNVFKATWYTVYRIARCNPLCKGGFDPVPGTSTTPHET